MTIDHVIGNNLTLKHLFLQINDFSSFIYEKTMQVITCTRKPLYMTFFKYINRTLKRLKINPSLTVQKKIKGDNMDVKKIIFALVVTSLLIGGACAASVNDFKIDDTYKNIYEGKYYSVYADSSKDSGVSIYKNVDDDVYDDIDNDDILDGVIHHDGRDYIKSDDDMKLDVGSDHITKFTDIDHATHGVSEVVKSGGEEYIVAFWAKDSSDMDTSKMLSALKDFNKDNNVEAIAF